jgi:hypothetical protein
MGWPHTLVHWLISDRLAEMAQRVAGRSRLAVWQRVVDRVANLGPTEARGYIRARAAVVIQVETDRLIVQEGEKVGRMRQRIIAAASHSLVETIAVQVQQRREAARRAA